MNERAKWTPGPWTRTRNIVRGASRQIAVLSGHSEKEYGANARLIALAPEMAEALRGWVERYPNNVGAAETRAILAKLDNPNGDA